MPWCVQENQIWQNISSSSSRRGWAQRGSFQQWQCCWKEFSFPLRKNWMHYTFTLKVLTAKFFTCDALYLSFREGVEQTALVLLLSLSRSNRRISQCLFLFMLLWRQTHNHVVLLVLDTNCKIYGEKLQQRSHNIACARLCSNNPTRQSGTFYRINYCYFSLLSVNYWLILM